MTSRCIACCPCRRFWADRVGIGAPDGEMVQAGAAPPNTAADTPESPWSWADCVGIGTPRVLPLSPNDHPSWPTATQQSSEVTQTSRFFNQPILAKKSRSPYQIHPIGGQSRVPGDTVWHPHQRLGVHVEEKSRMRLASRWTHNGSYSQPNFVHRCADKRKIALSGAMCTTGRA